MAELKKRKLRGFSVVVRFENLKKDLKEPSPGARRSGRLLDVSVPERLHRRGQGHLSA